MPGIVKRLLIAIVLVVGISSAWAMPVYGENYVGKIDLVQATSQGTRFFIRSQSPSLYATGDYLNILLQGYFKKSNFSIGYTPMACTGGIQGKCGKVNFVSVDVTNF